jgi:branched-chain amino acid transport system substrate-binding protein
MLQRIIGAAALTMALTGAATAAEPIKIGLIQSMTGALNTIGKAVVDGARLYVQQHGDTVAGRKIQLIVKDDASLPDVAKRMAQELIVNGKVATIGAGSTPSALTIAPLVTEAKIPTLLMVSGASITVGRSPYMVRTGFTLGQSSAVIADWATQNGAKKIVTIVNDWAPGLEAEAVFRDRVSKSSAKVVESIRVPLANPDFAPFLQRARDLGPDTLFAFFPPSQSGIFAKQFVERGMDKSGIRLLGPDDDELPGMTDAMLGIVTALHYSALHDSPLNKVYVKAFEAAYGKRPSFVSLGGYDGMHLIYEALKKKWRQHRRRCHAGRHEGHEMGEPTRTDVNRPGNAGRHPQRIHPQGREGGRAALQCRIRDRRSCEGPGQRGEEIASGLEPAWASRPKWSADFSPDECLFLARLGSPDRRPLGPLTEVDLPSDEVSGMAHFDPNRTCSISRAQFSPTSMH